MVLRPDIAIKVVGAAGSTVVAQFVEHLLRLGAGIALVVAASASRTPLAFTVIGGFLAVTSIAIMIAPRHWHIAYSQAAASRLNTLLVRLLFPVPVLFAGWLVWSGFPGLAL